MALRTQQSLCDQLEAYFKARPGLWIDGRKLATIAGAYAWRTRVSDLRVRGLRIDNVVTRGMTYRKSLYRYVPGGSSGAGGC